jgi:hypothetical protein
MLWIERPCALSKLITLKPSRNAFQTASVWPLILGNLNYRSTCATSLQNKFSDLWSNINGCKIKRYLHEVKGLFPLQNGVGWSLRVDLGVNGLLSRLGLIIMITLRVSKVCIQLEHRMQSEGAIRRWWLKIQQWNPARWAFCPTVPRDVFRRTNIVVCIWGNRDHQIAIRWRFPFS